MLRKNYLTIFRLPGRDLWATAGRTCSSVLKAAALPLFNRSSATFYRNFVFIYALESGKEIPLGTQDAEMLDSR